MAESTAKFPWEEKATQWIDEAKERQKWQKYLELTSDREAVKEFIRDRTMFISEQGWISVEYALKIQDEWIDHCLKEAGFESKNQSL